MATGDDRFEDDDRPRRRERPDYEQEHRGGLILALGIIGLVVCPLIGIAAWVMGNADIRAMNEGRMDPEGRQLTQVGKILGIVSGVLFLISMFFGLIALVAMIVLGAG